MRIGQIEAGGKPVTLIGLDFDNFNYVNSLYGYEIGNRVLEKIACHFDSVLHEQDRFCKLHGDHFLFCLQMRDPSAVSRLFTELTDLKFVLTDLLPLHYTLVASGGVLMVREVGTPLPALIDRVNCARKLSKGASVSTVHIYDERMNADAQWKKQVTSMMESALSGQEFSMYLQPKVLLKTGELMGAEALARWNSPTFGIIYPDRFVPILEQNGFVRRLDFFMLEEACRFLAAIREAGRPLLPISVNFAKSHLSMDKLVERIFAIVRRYDIPTRLIEIEFTENTFTDGMERLIEVVISLKRLGFRVSIDDFGSAYSSLNYLKDLPIDIVKIDKGFLNTSKDTDRGKIVISKIIELLKSLRILSVMEGVENEEQVEFLQKMGCDIGQGFFYAKPLSEEDYLEYLGKTNVLDDRLHLLATTVEELVSSELDHDTEHLENWEMYTLAHQIKARKETLADVEEAKEALHLSEEAFRIMAEQSDDTFFIWDYLDDTWSFSESRHTVWKSLAQKIPKARQNTALWTCIHPEDQADFESWMSALFRRPGHAETAFRVAEGPGQYLHVQARVTSLCDCFGIPVKGLGLFHILAQ